MGDETVKMQQGDLADDDSGEWVFPSSDGDGQLTLSLLCQFRIKICDEAGFVADAQSRGLSLIDVSYAAIYDESLQVTDRVLGHRRPPTIDRYNQLDDATLSQAAELLAISVAGERVAHSWGVMAV